MTDYFPSSLLVSEVSTATMGDDLPHPCSTTDIPFYAADFQCLTKAVKIGVSGKMGFVLFPNETYWTYNGNLRDFQVMNNTATEDGQVVILATVPNKFVEDALKQGYQRV